MQRGTFDTLQKFLSLGILVGVTALFGWVLSPFLMSIFWATVLAILLFPLQNLFLDVLKQRSLAALFSILVALLAICLPLYLVGSLALSEALDLYRHASEGSGQITRVAENPLISESLSFVGIDPYEAESKIVAWAKSAAGYLGGELLSVSLATLSTLLKVGVMLYLLFFFLRDGETLVRYFQRLIPFGDEKERILFRRFASTTRAVVKGTLVVSFAQGFVGGIIFFIAGVSSPVLWGAAMALMATIPAVGTIVIWLPAGLILLAGGALWQGIVVLLGGALVVGSIDNLLRPILVGRDTAMPDALVLLAILGGITSFGMAGIIIGPVIAALFLSIWDLFGKDFGDELAARG
jgi:predicted PurR-regulated permease PerM